MSNSILIGLHGKKRAGKDTVGELLYQLRGYRRVAFAAPIYDMLSALRIPLEYYADKQMVIPAYGKSVTELAQTLGTGWGRDMVDKNIWITTAMRSVQRYVAEGAVGVVVTDVRYDDEAEAIIAAGGKIYEVTGRGIVVNSHSSEQRISSHLISGEICNTGSREDLRYLLHTMF